MKRLELVFEPDGGSRLESKVDVVHPAIWTLGLTLQQTQPTPEMDRLKADNHVLKDVTGLRTKIYDDKWLDLDVRDEDREWGPFQRFSGADPHRRETMDSYKVGFALMLGRPVDFVQLPQRPEGHYYYRRWARCPTVIVLKLLEFADTFSDIDTMREDISDLILGPSLGRQEVGRFPTTYLRIACILRCETLFYDALALASGSLMEGGWAGDEQNIMQGLGGDEDLRALVLKQTVELQRSVARALSEMWCYTEPGGGIFHGLNLGAPIWAHWRARTMVEARGRHQR